MTTCWRCGDETELPLCASEGDVTVSLCDECMMGWLADDFSLVSAEERAARNSEPTQLAMFDAIGGSP